MRPRADKDTYMNAVLVAFVAAVFVLASPLHLLWMSPATPWYVPYVIWFGIIVVTWVVQQWRGRREL